MFREATAAERPSPFAVFRLSPSPRWDVKSSIVCFTNCALETETMTITTLYSGSLGSGVDEERS